MERWYLTVTGTAAAACLVLLASWVTDRQMVVRVRPLEALITQQADEIHGLAIARTRLEATVAKLESRIRLLQASPVSSLSIYKRPEPRPVPIFSR